ncbi:MAG: hypothetical protein Q4D90_07370 [bacterium]|nr:hypothetical protein [bacterium]
MEEARKQKIESMMRQYYEGKDVKSILAEEFGAEAAEREASVREYVKEFWDKEKEFQKQYETMDTQLAVFAAIDKSSEGKREKSFQMTSNMKYLLALRNLEEGKVELEAEGMDLAFMRETLQKTYEKELEIAKDASEEEFAQLQKELEALLEEEPENVFSLLEEEDSEESRQLLETIREAKKSVTEKDKEELSVLAAAVMLAENPKMTEQEAAYQASYFMGLLNGLPIEILDVTLSVLGTFGIVGLALKILGDIVGSLTVTIIGSYMIVAAVAALSLLALGCAGHMTAQMLKDALPHAKKLAEKASPHTKRAAEKAKEAVAVAFGFVSAKVLRPVIYWANNSARPFLAEHVYYPMRRRLEGIWSWILEKSEQVKDFLYRAAHEPVVATTQEEVTEEEEAFEDESLEENEDEEMDEEESQSEGEYEPQPNV